MGAFGKYSVETVANLLNEQITKERESLKKFEL